MRIMKTDYHIHSRFSSDAHDTPYALCKRALAFDFTEIAITEHAEWHEEGDGFANVKDYLHAVEKCRQTFEPQGLTLLSGVELGNPHEFAEETNKLLAENQLDITIGSLHHLYGLNIHTPACFKGRNPYTVIEDYFLELARMSALADFKILGHFDRIFVQPAKMGVSFDPERLEGPIRTALFTIIKRGQILELNTKNFSYEPQWILVMLTLLRWYREMGGYNIVVNSDAHRKEELGRNFELARIILKAAGFRTKENIPTRFPASNPAGISQHSNLAGLAP